MSAPGTTSRRIAATCPYRAASCNGVDLSSRFASLSAPSSTNTFNGHDRSLPPNAAASFHVHAAPPRPPHLPPTSSPPPRRRSSQPHAGPSPSHPHQCDTQLLTCAAPPRKPFGSSPSFVLQRFVWRSCSDSHPPISAVMGAVKHHASIRPTAPPTPHRCGEIMGFSMPRGGRAQRSPAQLFRRSPHTMSARYPTPRHRHTPHAGLPAGRSHPELYSADTHRHPLAGVVRLSRTHNTRNTCRQWIRLVP